MTTPTIPQPRTPVDDDDHAEVWALVARAQAGDADAFGEIWRLHHGDVLTYVGRRVRHTETAEDITADVFLAAWRHIANISYEGKALTAWLMTTARNRVIDYVRSGHNQRSIATGNALELDGRDPAVDIEEQAVSNDEARAVRAAVLQLTDSQRAAITLTCFDGLSGDEAGALLGVSAEAVKALTLRARRALLPLLADITRS